MPKIIDNIQNFLNSELSSALDISYKADFCVGYFNLRGWKEVVNKIDKFEGGENSQCRVLVGMQKQPQIILQEYFSSIDEDGIDNQRALKIKKDFAQEFKNQLIIGVPTNSDESSLRKLAKQIKENKVVVKLFVKHNLHAKLYLAYREDKFNPLIGFLGSSNLTLSGLAKQGELNVDVLEQDAAVKLEKWFNDRWNDRWCIDISKELIEAIETSWASEELIPPYYVYLKMAFHLSREARSGLAEFNIPRVFKNKLFDYQQKAVLIAAHHLHKRGGVLIGDVVGLGKTFTAAAIAKIFEDDFFLETLIICPKNLVKMWEDYVHEYQLRAKVISISVVQNELPNMKRYRVVVIDESHNLRNKEGRRYNAIKEYIGQNESKVILLTATPYNKAFTDLSNQLRLFIQEDKDIGISPERFIETIGGTYQFNAKHQVNIRSIAAFEKSEFIEDWQELMRLYLVRRTRSFIKNNYAVKDESTGRYYLTFSDGTKNYFPDRLPKKLDYHFDPKDITDQYAKLYTKDVVDTINSLELPRYGLANYLLDNIDLVADKEDENTIANLSRAGKRLMGFARTNLFKRLESSGHSFLLSIGRHIVRNYTFIHAIQNDLDLPIGSPELDVLEFMNDDLDLDDYQTKWEDFTEGTLLSLASDIYSTFSNDMQNRFTWITSSYFKKDLLKYLKSDSEKLLRILALGNNWDPDKDRQLNSLIELCTKKHKSEKILIFTQYADTAKYLYSYFDKNKIPQTALVTGADENPTSFAYRFSPISNNKGHITGTQNELRILIATDVLSEGQNLQDAHIIVNYDLPWAIIKLIQRAGRVDRIGQKSDKILCYSVLPEDGIEQIIRLRTRLRTRIEENSEVVGSDETFFEGDPVNIADLYNEKSGILDDDKDTEVDLGSYAYQIWKNAVDKDHTLSKKIQNLPNVIYSSKKHDDENSVIVYARSYDDNDLLIQINEEGETITQSQMRILNTAKCEPNEKALEKLSIHHELVAKGVELIKETDDKTGGQLGKTTSARYKTYQRLSRYYEENIDTLFVNENLKKAVDDIYKFPLKEYAREALNRQIKSGIDDAELANMVIALREENRLCIIDENEQQINKQPQIICSMGLIK
ncbi:MAG: hypothetical protein K8F60_06970 [Melioribacteraceae bacterium]|nr:hypothetical protein [Melioribacteraceae bacterium]